MSGRGTHRQPSRPTRFAAWYLLPVATAAFWLAPEIAQAQTSLLVIPFIGAKFAGHTNLPDLDNPLQPGGAKKTTFGASGAILGDGIVGVEGDLEHTPHFFERGIRWLI